MTLFIILLKIMTNNAGTEEMPHYMKSLFISFEMTWHKWDNICTNYALKWQNKSGCGQKRCKQSSVRAYGAIYYLFEQV